jgi:hypothetical protein
LRILLLLVLVLLVLVVLLHIIVGGEVCHLDLFAQRAALDVDGALRAAAARCGDNERARRAWARVAARGARMRTRGALGAAGFPARPSIMRIRARGQLGLAARACPADRNLARRVTGRVAAVRAACAVADAAAAGERRAAHALAPAHRVPASPRRGLVQITAAAARPRAVQNNVARRTGSGVALLAARVRTACQYCANRHAQSVGMQIACVRRKMKKKKNEEKKKKKKKVNYIYTYVSRKACRKNRALCRSGASPLHDRSGTLQPRYVDMRHGSPGGS